MSKPNATPKQPKVSLTFCSRPKRHVSELTQNRTYRSKCGRFELVEVRWFNPQGYGRYWLAVGRALPFIFCDRRRTRKAAERRIKEALRCQP